MQLKLLTLALALAAVSLPSHGEDLLDAYRDARANDPVLAQADATRLATLSAQLVSVDIHADFTAAAGARLRQAGIGNASLVTGEAVRSWQPDGVFDVLVVTGAVAEIPARWHAWLKPGGRAFVVSGQSPVQSASLLVHEADGGLREQNLFETDLPYLVHAEPAPRFVF